MRILYNDDVLYDTDCLSCFLAVGQCDILQKLFNKIIVTLIVQNEILNQKTPIEVRENFNYLVKSGFVEIKQMGVGTPEHKCYNNLKKNYSFLGDGEASVIAMVCKNGGVIASNNIYDVRGLVEDFNLNLITTAFILAKAYEEGIKSRKELDVIWKDMIRNGRKRSLPPVKSFTDYYEGKYNYDCFYMGLE